MLLCCPQKSKLKLGKSLPLGVETAGSGANRSPRRSFRKGERREPSWAGRCCVKWGRGAVPPLKGAHGPHHHPSVCPRGRRRRWERHAVAGIPGLAQLLSQPGPGLPVLSQHSRQPLDRGEFIAAPALWHHTATGHAHSTASLPQGHRKSLGGSEAELPAKAMKYCCVYLPDGTASLASIRPGHSIRDMLAGICEKRGFSLPDIKVYLVGNEQVGWAGGEGGPASWPVPRLGPWAALLALS